MQAPGTRLSTVSAAVLLLALLLVGGPNAAAGQHHTGGDPGAFAKYHTAVNLGNDNFTTYLSQMDPDAPALIEFFASWCPACRAFAADYEQVSVFFKNHDLSGKKVFVGRVDCASETMCNKFAIRSYPSVQFARVRQWLAGQDVELYPKHRQRTPDDIAAWVGEQIGVKINYQQILVDDMMKDYAKHSATKEGAGGANVQAAGAGGAGDGGAGAGAGQVASPSPAYRAPPFDINNVWAKEDLVGATVQLWQIITSTSGLLSDAAARHALLDVLNLLAEGHPVDECRNSISSLVRSMNGIWPEGTAEAPAALRQWLICGPAEFRGWVTCQGSSPDTRGYSCGLWELFHTVSFRLPEATASQSMMTALLSFNQHFFLCEPCQKHFAKMLTAPEARAVNARDALHMWLWSTHNEVNIRLRGIEEKYGHSTTGDAAFPKRPWPTQEMCPACHQPGSTDTVPLWDTNQVTKFLAQAYGPRPGEKWASAGGSMARAGSERKGAQQQQQASAQIAAAGGGDAAAAGGSDGATVVAKQEDGQDVTPADQAAPQTDLSRPYRVALLVLGVPCVLVLLFYAYGYLFGSRRRPGGHARSK